MKKSILLLLAMTLIFTIFCGVTVMANDTVARVSLWNNLSYYSSTVPSDTKLVVSAYNAENQEVSLEGKTITYKSQRPWVVDVDENGTLIDNGYCGSTKITATVDGVSGSFILVKTDGDGPGSFNRTYLVYNDDETYGNDSHAFTGTTGYIYKRAFNNDTDKTSALATNGERDFDNNPSTNTGHYANLTTGGGNADFSLLLDYRSVSWDVQGQQRLKQIWFYDDGSSPLNIEMYACQAMDGTQPGAIHGVNTTWQEAAGSKHYGYYWYGNLSAAQDSTVYTTTATTVSMNTINRTPGWHQATTVIEESGAIKLYIDGEELLTAKFASSDGAKSRYLINANTAGKYDDIVFAGNPNTEKPADFKMPAVDITLSKNTSFLTSVDENESLIVTAVDKNGDDTVLPSDVTYTYESTHPWVLDIAEDGKFIDGGYDGSTIVTVTASNGMEASLVFIKGNLNGVNAHTDGLGERSSFTSESGCMWRTYTSLANATLNATGGHNGGDYYQKNTTTGEDAADYGVAIRYARGSWDNEGQIRIAQGWFYDDGVSAVNIHMVAAQRDPEEYSVGSGVTEAQLASWRKWGLDPDLVKARPTNIYTKSFYWHGGILAAEGEAAYSKKELSSSEKTSFERKVGWHQATMILGEDGSINIYLDGQKFHTSHISEGNGGDQFYIMGSTVGKYDDMVLASNPNDTKPVEEITVKYNEEQGSVSCNNNVIGNNDSAEVYYDETAKFTFAPAEGYELDTVSYDGKDVTAFIQNGVLSVDAKTAELVVAFKEKAVVAPSVSKTVEIDTDETVSGYPAALMYMQIHPGYGYTVKNAGVILSDKENDKENGLELIALNQDNSNVTSGLFGIRVYGPGLNGINCYFNPFVKYQKGEEIETVYGEQDSFILNK